MTLFDASAPICLPWKSGNPIENLNVGDELTITGWGKITNSAFYTFKELKRTRAASRRLQKLKVRTKDNEVLKILY